MTNWWHATACHHCGRAPNKFALSVSLAHHKRRAVELLTEHKEIGMKRSRFIFIASAVLASYVLAQPAPPAANGGPPQGPGRGAPVVIGPPAPVPPEVAIPRPTPQELAQVNDALKNWVASDKSQVKPLLEKFQPLMMLQPPRANNAATYTQTAQRQGARHLGFVETASKGDIDLLLHGDPSRIGGCRAMRTRPCSTSISAA